MIVPQSTVTNGPDARAPVVDRERDDLLSRPALAHEEDGRVHLRDPPGEVDDTGQCRQ